MANTNYWLLKTEPETFSWEELERNGSTNWNGVRNFQARNFLKQIKKNDLCFVYHSGDDRAVVGIAKASKEFYADVDKDDPKQEWVQIDIVPVKKLKQTVTLAAMKALAAKEPEKLGDFLLLRQSRLSVVPVNALQAETILKLAETKI